jgi:hypothetical protein
MTAITVEDDTRLSIEGYEEIPLSEITRFPALEACYRAWLDAHENGIMPAALDIDAVPESVLPYVMLLDYMPEIRDVEVRIAGNYVGERTSAEFGGRRLRNFFDRRDAEIVFASMEHVAETRTPSIAKRTYVSLEQRYFEYVRIILPVSADGETVTGFFKTIEPDTLLTHPELDDA